MPVSKRKETPIAYVVVDPRCCQQLTDWVLKISNDDSANAAVRYMSFRFIILS